jgi:hypothetical protein
VVTAGNIALRSFLATLAIASWACGPATPPRTVVTSSAAEVSAAEGVGEQARPDQEPSPDERDEGQDSQDKETGARQGGNLIVRSPPDTRTTRAAVGFRRDVEGAPLLGQERTWVGIEVPDFIDLTDESRELTTLDTGAEGYLAVYRDPVGAESCPSDDDSTCKVSVVLYSATGKKLWSYQLEKYLERTTNLQVFDVRYHPPYLFFNQSCPGDKKADPVCGRLIAVDTRESKLHFRSSKNTSAGPIVTTESVIITSAPRGKGAQLSTLAISDGSPLSNLKLAIAPVALEVDADGKITITDATGASATAQLSPENRLQAAQ